MEFCDSDKIRAVRQAVRSFCERELAPMARDIDRDNRFPWEVADKMGHLGYFGIQAPRGLGGAGMDTVAYVTIVEEVSRVCAAMGLCISVHNSVALFPLLHFGSAEQKQKWGPALATSK